MQRDICSGWFRTMLFLLFLCVYSPAEALKVQTYPFYAFQKLVIEDSTAYVVCN